MMCVIELFSESFGSLQ